MDPGENHTWDQLDAVILHGDNLEGLAKTVCEELRSIAISDDKLPTPRVELLETLVPLGRNPIDFADYVFENTTLVLFFRCEEFFEDKLNGFHVYTCMKDRIESKDPKRNWTVIPLDIGQKTSVKGKLHCNGLTGLIVSSKGEVSKKNKDKFKRTLVQSKVTKSGQDKSKAHEKNSYKTCYSEQQRGLASLLETTSTHEDRNPQVNSDSNQCNGHSQAKSQPPPANTNTASSESMHSDARRGSGGNMAKDSALLAGCNRSCETSLEPSEDASVTQSSSASAAQLAAHVGKGAGHSPTMDDCTETGDQMLSTGDSSPPNVDHTLPTVEPHPLTADHPAPTVELLTAEKMPPIVEHMPPTVDKNPHTVDHALPVPTFDHSPPTVDNVLPTLDHLPTTAGHSPLTADHTPPTPDHTLPTVDNVSPTVDQRPPTVYNMPLTADHPPLAIIKHTQTPVKYTPQTSDYAPRRADYTPQTTVHPLPIVNYAPLTADYTTQTAVHPPPIVDHAPQTADYPTQTSDYTPQAAVHPPPIVDYAPLTIDYAPQTAVHPPPIVDYAPLAIDYAPQTAVHPPPIVDYAPLTVDYAPQTAVHPPPIVDHAPKTAVHPPPIVDHAPKTAVHPPPIVDYAPVTADYTPQTGDYAPQTAVHPPPIVDYAPQTAVHPPPIVDHAPQTVDYVPQTVETMKGFDSKPHVHSATPTTEPTQNPRKHLSSRNQYQNSGNLSKPSFSISYCALPDNRNLAFYQGSLYKQRCTQGNVRFSSVTAWQQPGHQQAFLPCLPLEQLQAGARPRHAYAWPNPPEPSNQLLLNKLNVQVPITESQQYCSSEKAVSHNFQTAGHINLNDELETALEKLRETSLTPPPPNHDTDIQVDNDLDSDMHRTDTGTSRRMPVNKALSSISSAESIGQYEEVRISDYSQHWQKPQTLQQHLQVGLLPHHKYSVEQQQWQQAEQYRLQKCQKPQGSGEAATGAKSITEFGLSQGPMSADSGRGTFPPF